MKIRIGSFILILFVAALTSCDKTEDLLTFRLSYGDSFIIPSAIGLNVPLSLPMPPQETNAETKFSDHNTAADYVKNVRLNSINLSISKPEGKNFNFLRAIRVYISSTNQPEKLVIETGDIPNDVLLLKLVANQDNFDAYLKDQEIALRAEVVVDETLLEDLTVKYSIDFTVTADPL